MFSTIKYIIKNLFRKIGIENFGTKFWFQILSIFYGVNYKFDNSNNKIYISKKLNQLIIKGNNSNFGSSGIVIRDFDNVFKSVMPKIVDGIKIVDFSIPQVHTLSESKRQFLFHDICEPISVTDLYLKYGALNEGDIVFDIGTYAGTQTIFFSEKVGQTGKVFAFEPDQNSFKSLKRNIELNSVNNVTALELGLYDFDGKIFFTQGGSMGSQIIESSVKNIDLPSINVAKIETIVKKYAIEKVDFVKMDIEGAELNVLKSSVDFINKFKPRFIIEPHFIKGVLNLKEIEAFFAENNYLTQNVKQGGFEYQPLVYAYPKI